MNNTKWINKDAWDLENAWRKWRDATAHIPIEQAKTHKFYKNVEKILNKIKEDEIL